MLKPGKNEIRKPTKTISGITPVAVMLPPRKCEHGLCSYCPNLGVPQSYTPKSPVVMRASEVDYDSFKQIRARIKAFEAMNHKTDKIEIIIMGGTFLQYPEDFKYKFIKGCYDGLNQKKSRTLEEAQKINQTAKHRCIALCVETRPDVCVDYISQMRKFGVTRVELGVQILDNKIYKKIKRGHTVQDVVIATKYLKNAGFKIGYHIMPGLPGSNFKKDLKLFKELFSDSRFKPDQLKIYPCQVIPGSELESLYWKGGYKPYDKKQTIKVLTSMLKAVPRYCRVMRIMREIPPEYLVAGVINIDLRKDIEEKLRRQEAEPLANSSKRGQVNEIRYRESGFALRDKRGLDLNLNLKITKYVSSGAREFFIEVVNKDDLLFGLLRLRINGNIGIIRELHVYGKTLNLGEKSDTASQHHGLGKWLMNEAESICKKNKCKKISVISGIGVREYYKNLGYKLEDTYMIKNI
jgi:elongator complex protein 3